MNDSVINPEFFSLASQLYVRMRRYGRVVDAVYMAKNHDYAREILQLAGREADVEILKIIVRFEILLAHEYPSIEPKAVEPEEKLVVEKDGLMINIIKWAHLSLCVKQMTIKKEVVVCSLW